MRREQPYGKRYDDADQIEPKHKYFIACEGKKAEYRYFKGLLDARDELGISQLIEVLPIRHGEGTNSHPLTIINEAKEVTDDCDTYFPAVDSVCIIVDRDAKSFTSSQYDKAVALCVEFGFRFIVSNPCMELWLLLHYSDSRSTAVKNFWTTRRQGIGRGLRSCSRMTICTAAIVKLVYTSGGISCPMSALQSRTPNNMHKQSIR